MKKYDLHVHTKASSCSNLTPETILKTAKNVGLDGIAVVDHNTLKGALEVKKLNHDRDFEVIVGSEIATDKGHLLALYLKKDIKEKNFEKVIKEIKKQGGIAVISHPFLFNGIRLTKNKIDFKKLDAIEAFNARSILFYFNLKARKLAKKHNLPITGGSDSHFSFEIGEGLTYFEGDLRKELKQKKTKVNGRYLSGVFGILFSEIYKRIINRKFYKLEKKRNSHV